MTPYHLTIPFPPTVNSYYENRQMKVRKGPAAGKRYVGRKISDEGNAFARLVAVAARSGHRTPPRLEGRLSISVYVVPPEVNRVRDLDNLWKGLLDALRKADVIGDDSLFDHEEIHRGNPSGEGYARLVIRRYDPRESEARLSALSVWDGHDDLLGGSR